MIPKEEKMAEEENPADDETKAIEEENKILPTVAAVAVVGAGVAIFEAALLPGVALGVIAMLIPQTGSMLRSGVKEVYRAGKKLKEGIEDTHIKIKDELDIETNSK